MTTVNLVIPPSSSALPTCNPNLMPFHIDYTGPAAVSAYMRIEKLQSENATAEIVGEEVEEVTEKKETVKVTAEANGEIAVVETETNTTTTTTITDTVMGDSTPTAPGSEEVTIATTRALSTAVSEDTIVVESQASASTVVSSSTPQAVLEDADRRFVSTFRGRAIHGLTVDLPEGYGGLLFKSSGKESMKGQDDTIAKQMKSKAIPAAKVKAKVVEEKPAKPRGRVTRSAAIPKQSAPIEVDSEPEDKDEEMADASTHADIDATAPSDDRPIRELIPTAQFSTFTLWHADRLVDKGRDEYARTLTEWISLANEIHCSDL